MELGRTTGRPHYIKSASFMDTDAHGTLLQIVMVLPCAVSTDLEASCHLTRLGGLTAVYAFPCMATD